MGSKHTLGELNNLSREELITIILGMQGQLDALNENIEKLIEQVRLANQQSFGRHTETMASIDIHPFSPHGIVPDVPRPHTCRGALHRAPFHPLFLWVLVNICTVGTMHTAFRTMLSSKKPAPVTGPALQSAFQPMTYCRCTLLCPFA